MGGTTDSRMAFAGRILPFADFHMSAGALLPLFAKPVIEAVACIIKKWELQHPEMGLTRLPPRLEAGFSAQVIRAAMRAGALDNISYSDIIE